MTTHFRFSKFATKLYKGKRGMNGTRVWVTRCLCTRGWVPSSATLLAQPRNARAVDCEACLVQFDRWLEVGRGKPLTYRRWRAVLFGAVRETNRQMRLAHVEASP